MPLNAWIVGSPRPQDMSSRPAAYVYKSVSPVRNTHEAEFNLRGKPWVEGDLNADQHIIDGHPWHITASKGWLSHCEPEG